MICDIAIGLVAVVMVATNVISFLLGYIQKGLESENVEKKYER